MSDCLFCAVAAGEIGAEIVAESDDWVAFRDIRPQAPVHVLVIPREHVSTTNEVGPEHEDLLGRLVRAGAQVADAEGIAESGYRIVVNCNEAAGQTVFHLHLHVLGGRSLGRELNEEDVIGVLTRARKQRREAAEQCEKGGREDLADKERAEEQVVAEYLPEPLSNEELDRLIDEAIESTGADSPKGMGPVMGRVMAEAKGRVEGAEVSRRVRERLQDG